MTKPKRWLLRIGLVGLALLILIILSLALVPYEAQAKTATVTAYSELDSCHYPGCPMASGKKAYIGAVACPRHIKLGTTVIISGLPLRVKIEQQNDTTEDTIFSWDTESKLILTPLFLAKEL